MSLLDKLLGRPLKSSETKKEELGVATGVPVLGLDALASTAYGPEAALTILVPLGMTGLHYMPMVTIGILALLATLYMSYRQTAAAYPGGGGAYFVAKDNLGMGAGVAAGTALLLITCSTLPLESQPGSAQSCRQFQRYRNTDWRLVCWCSSRSLLSTCAAFVRRE